MDDLRIEFHHNNMTRLVISMWFTKLLHPTWATEIVTLNDGQSVVLTRPYKRKRIRFTR